MCALFWKKRIVKKYGVLGCAVLFLVAGGFGLLIQESQAATCGYSCLVEPEAVAVPCNISQTYEQVQPVCTSGCRGVCRALGMTLAQGASFICESDALDTAITHCSSCRCVPNDSHSCTLADPPITRDPGV